MILNSIFNIDPKIKFRKASELFVDEPVIVYVNDFDNKDVQKFSDDFQKAHNTGQEIIPIVINSYGGSVTGLLAMVAQIKSSPLVISTIVSGAAMSAGCVLLTCGKEGYRFAAPYSTIMIHEVSCWAIGKNEEIKAISKDVERDNKIIFAMMAKNCGHKDPNYFLKIVHSKKNADWYLKSGEALRHNIVNKIKVPSFTTSVKVETTFG